MRSNSCVATFVGGVLSLGGVQAVAVGQCHHIGWTGDFATPSLGLGNAAALDFRVFDPDGSGPLPAELVAAGNFITAGGSPANRIARWNGSRWAALGSGLENTANPTFCFASALGIWDPDGPGQLNPRLVVAGRFNRAGSVPVLNVAQWDGQNWQAMGQGISAAGIGAFSFAEFDPDGVGLQPSSLVIAGAEGFTVPPDTQFTYTARWDGVEWTRIPFGVNGPYNIFDIEVFDEDGVGGAPPRLFAATDGFSGLYRWDGVEWTVVGGGLRSGNHLGDALAVVDEDGPGPGRAALFVGGFFTMAGNTPANYIARWDGQQFTAIGAGLTNQAEAILPVYDPNGASAPTIYAGTLANGVYRFDRATGVWNQIGDSNAIALGEIPVRLHLFDEDGPAGHPPSIYYASAGMTSISGTPSFGLARYGCRCYANCDGSWAPPSLNVNDFICFMNRFAAALALPPAAQQADFANCDGSTVLPVLNVNDYVCFNNRFANGCP
ncbi:MAG: hypothetical protein ACKVW3_16625 [Phycisphaerales bacterium]